MSQRQLPESELALIAETAQREGIDPNALRALRLAENGGPGREFGVLSVPAPTYTDQAEVAARSFRNHERRYREQTGREPMEGGRYTEDFLRDFSSRYAPLGAANDPTNLNQYHARNLIDRYREQSLLPGQHSPQVFLGRSPTAAPPTPGAATPAGAPAGAPSAGATALPWAQAGKYHYRRLDDGQVFEYDQPLRTVPQGFEKLELPRNYSVLPRAAAPAGGQVAGPGAPPAEAPKTALGRFGAIHADLARGILEDAPENIRQWLRGPRLTMGLDAPESTSDYVNKYAGQLAAMLAGGAAGGAALPAAPAVGAALGRVGTGTAIGAGQALGRGSEAPVWETALDAMVLGASEVLGFGIPRVASFLTGTGRARAGYERDVAHRTGEIAKETNAWNRAKGAVDTANRTAQDAWRAGVQKVDEGFIKASDLRLKAVRDAKAGLAYIQGMLPPGTRLLVPSLGGRNPITFQQAFAGLMRTVDQGKAPFLAARDELLRALKAAGGGPATGTTAKLIPQNFPGRPALPTYPPRPTPGGYPPPSVAPPPVPVPARVAAANAAKPLKNPAMAAVDTAADQDTPGHEWLPVGFPIGVNALNSVRSPLTWLSRALGY